MNDAFISSHGIVHSEGLRLLLPPSPSGLAKKGGVEKLLLSTLMAGMEGSSKSCQKAYLASVTVLHAIVITSLWRAWLAACVLFSISSSQTAGIVEKQKDATTWIVIEGSKLHMFHTSRPSTRVLGLTGGCGTLRLG